MVARVGATGGQGVNRHDALAYLATHRQAVLATIRKDGRPQLSNVLVVKDGDRFLVSITETRAKYQNLLRDPRATVLVLGDTFWQYLVVDGTVTFVRGQEALPLLRRYYEMATGGPHEDWNEYDEAMVREKRVVACISIDHMYPLSE